MKLLFYLAVAAFLYWYFQQLQKKQRRLQGEGRAPRATPSGPSPHEVLGVEPDASQEAIRQAYQQKVRGYHPDKVANASDELRELAERRTKEINAAYEALNRR